MCSNKNDPHIIKLMRNDYTWTTSAIAATAVIRSVDMLRSEPIRARRETVPTILWAMASYWNQAKSASGATS